VHREAFRLSPEPLRSTSSPYLPHDHPGRATLCDTESEKRQAGMPAAFFGQQPKVGRDSVEPTIERSEASDEGLLQAVVPCARDARVARASFVGKVGSTGVSPYLGSAVGSCSGDGSSLRPGVFAFSQQSGLHRVFLTRAWRRAVRLPPPSHQCAIAALLSKRQHAAGDFKRCVAQFHEGGLLGVRLAGR
jgi:hypothetical protein